MRSHKGFTIVELLIVIVVIGILAALVIVAYQGVQNRANDAAIQSDLTNTAKKLQIYQLDNNAYPTGATWQTLEPALQAANLKFSKSAYATATPSDSNLLYLNSNSGQDYGIVAKSKSGKVFCYGSKFPTIQDCTSTGGGSGFPTSGSGPYRTLLGMDSSYASWGWSGTAWLSWAG